MDTMERPFEFVTTKEAAKILGKAPQTLRKWRAAKKGPPFYEVGGGQIRYRPADVREWMENRPKRVDPENAAQGEQTVDGADG